MSARWVSLPVEHQSDLPLVEGETLRARLRSGGILECTWDKSLGGGHAFYDADGDPLDVVAVEVSWPEPRGLQ